MISFKTIIIYAIIVSIILIILSLLLTFLFVKLINNHNKKK